MRPIPTTTARPLLKSVRAHAAALAVFIAAAAGAGPAFGQVVSATLAVGTNPLAIALNPITDRVYVANQGSGTVSVIDGATNATSTVSVGSDPSAIAVNPDTNRVYVANEGSNTVTVIDGATNATTSVGVAAGPLALAVDPVANRVYVASKDSSDVTVIDGATNAATTIATAGTMPIAIATNPASGKVYVANFSSDNVTVINEVTGTIDATIGVPAGPGRIAVNPVTNRIYVGSFTLDGQVTVIDGATNATTVLAPPSGHGGYPIAIAANPVTNRVYVAFSGEIGVIDGATNAMTFVAQAAPPSLTSSGYRAVAVNTVTDRIYAPNGNGFLVVIDGDSNAATRLSIPPMGAYSGSIALNPLTNRAYVANPAVSVVDGSTADVAHAIPLATTVAAQAKDGGTGVALTFTAQSRFAPIAPAVRKVYYQLDRVSGAWQAADGSGPFSASLSGLAPGTHVVYAFATDGQDATSVTTGPQSAPLLGAVASYTFTISALSTAPAPTPTPGAVDVQGLWWASPAGSESGWGVNLTQQGSTLFATWFTYDVDGSGMWLVMSNGTQVGDNTYSGTLYRATGPAFNAPFDPSQVKLTPVGQVMFGFTDANNGTFAYTVNGVSGRKAITRQVYASPLTTCTVGGAPGAAPNYQDLWWSAPAGSESGWGLNVTQQGDVLFVTWFTYDVNGKGMWLVASNLARTGATTYSGTLYQTFGPPFSTDPWRAASVSMLAVGQATLTFTDANDGTFAYTVNGVSGSKAITRQVFSSPASVCQ